MLCLEPLERRDAPAASITLTAGVLEIVGTDNAADYIAVRPSADNLQITASILTDHDNNGSTPLVDAVAPQTFAAADIEEIVVNPLGGYNSFGNSLYAGTFTTSVFDIHVTYLGGSGVDSYFGAANADIFLGGGNDIARVFDANFNHSAIVFGGDGNDQIRTSNGNDYLDGGSGNDRLESGAGDDIIYGRSGDDYIDSGVGTFFNTTVPNDTVHGGSGTDTLANPQKWWSKAPPEKLVTGIEVFL